jgi:hypothetical protein
VSITHPGLGGVAYNVFHMRVTDFADFGDAMGALVDFYESLDGFYITGTDILVGDGVIADPYGTPTYAAWNPVLVEGAGTGDVAPQLLAAVVSWRTTSATRSGRGRTFIGPVTAAVWGADGTIDNTYLASLTNAAAALVSASTGANGWAFGVYSHKDSVLRDFIGSGVKDRASYLSSRRD